MKLSPTTQAAATITDVQNLEKVVQKDGKKLNLLMVCPYFFPDPGGLQNYAYNISKKMVEKGHKVTVLCSTKSKEDSIEYIDGIKVIRQKPNFIFSNTPIKFDLFFKMSTLIKRNKFDLVNAATPVPFYSDIASLVCKIYKVPFILTYHNDLIKPNFPLSLVSTIYNCTLGSISLKISSPIITPSPYCYNESRFLSPFKNKLVLIPPAVNLDNYHVGKSLKPHDTHKIPYSSNIILFVGQLSKTHTHKGVDYLIRAFSDVLKVKKDVYLIIVGTGDMIPTYQNLCAELQISAKVMFPGFVEEEDLIEYYKGADIIVLPSTRVAEGFGMVLIEGGACGKPVIGTKVGGIQYVVKHNKTGLLVPPKDNESLTSSILYLLNSEEIRSEMGNNGRRLVEKNYTWSRISKLTEKTYEDVI